MRPETVVRWHRQGFRLYWRWNSRSWCPGRPRIELEIRDLIIEMHRANPTWGAPRIHGELVKLGFRLAQSTVSKYLPRHRKPPSQSWRTFLRNHLWEAIAIDFAVVSTIRFGLLYVFVVLGLERRRLLHVHVTAHPMAAWTAQQMIEALPEETGVRYVIRDRDAIYGTEFQRRVAGMGLTEVLIAPRSPWQNAYAERFVGSLRRECLDHVIAVNSGRSTGSSRTMPATTIVQGLIWPLRRMLPNPGESNRERMGESSHSLRWADSTIDTSGWWLEW